MKSFKIYFTETGDCRRIRPACLPTWSTFRGLVEDMVLEKEDRPLLVQWKDEDGDKCTITTQMEWGTFLEECKAKDPVHVFVSHGEAPLLNSALLSPVAQEVASREEEEAAAEEEAAEEEAAAPEVAEAGSNAEEEGAWTTSAREVEVELFSGTNAAMYDVKDVSSAVQAALQAKEKKEMGFDKLRELKYTLASNGDLLLNVDVTALSREMHCNALAFLTEEADNEMLRGAVRLMELCAVLDEHSSQSNVTHYNLACAYSRVMQWDEAVDQLLVAVRKGFKAVDVLKDDTDLAPLRSHPLFGEILSAVEANDKNAKAVEDEEKVAVLVQEEEVEVVSYSDDDDDGEEEEEEEVEEQVEEWACGLCTFRNKDEHVECQICGASRIFSDEGEESESELFPELVNSSDDDAEEEEEEG
eukprot:CAMPEP_0119119140 /NCGR_PEP_ID=MMETSP1310-20130426/762_1 /TAXON_ID=464262 /ORGANISM="Genus nov. species nov., Strain RCC2339" /LENGTH=414 /DNA_ID=CAMNT_0007108557 /DNA_START=118 /DNA_END=1358 /DNA_ORIENTATION=-